MFKALLVFNRKKMEYSEVNGERKGWEVQGGGGIFKG